MDTLKVVFVTICLNVLIYAVEYAFHVDISFLFRLLIVVPMTMIICMCTE